MALFIKKFTPCKCKTCSRRFVFHGLFNINCCPCAASLHTPIKVSSPLAVLQLHRGVFVTATALIRPRSDSDRRTSCPRQSFIIMLHPQVRTIKDAGQRPKHEKVTVDSDHMKDPKTSGVCTCLTFKCSFTRGKRSEHGN